MCTKLFSPRPRTSLGTRLKGLGSRLDAAGCVHMALGHTLAIMAGWVAPLVHIGDGVKRIQMRGYNKMELSDGVFMVWTTLMLLGGCTCGTWAHFGLY